MLKLQVDYIGRDHPQKEALLTSVGPKKLCTSSRSSTLAHQSAHLQIPSFAGRTLFCAIVRYCYATALGIGSSRVPMVPLVQLFIINMKGYKFS